jgi:hypothetical protein
MTMLADGLLPARRVDEAPAPVLAPLLFPEKLYETAERYPIERVFGLSPLAYEERARRKTDAEFIDSHPEYLGREEMPEFVRDDKEHEYRYDNERGHIHSPPPRA